MDNEEYSVRITSRGFELADQTKYKAIAKDVGAYKIYIFKKGKTFLYVGITRQRVSSRMSASFRIFLKKEKTNQSSKGYSGHKFIGDYKDRGALRLYVFALAHIIGKKKEAYEEAEAIEAEIVYAIRSKTNKWPRYQNEIHFNNFYSTAKYVKFILKQTGLN